MTMFIKAPFVLREGEGGGAGGTAMGAASGVAAATDAAPSPWAGLDADGMAFVGERGWKSGADAVSAFRDYQGRSVELPAEMTADTVKPLLSRLGAPEGPDGYTIGAPDQLPEGVIFDEGRAAWFKDIAAKAGLLPWQAEMIAADSFNHEATVAKAMMEKAAEAEAAKAETAKKNQEIVNKAWGNEAEKKNDLAERGIRSFAEKVFTQTEMKAALEEISGLDATKAPYLRRLFAAVGEAVTSAPGVHGSGGAAPAVLFPKSQADWRAATGRG